MDEITPSAEKLANVSANDRARPAREFLVYFEIRDGDNEYCVRFMARSDMLRDLLPDIGSEFNPDDAEGQRCIDEAVRQWDDEGYVELDGGTRLMSDLRLKPIAPADAKVLRKYLYW